MSSIEPSGPRMVGLLVLAVSWSSACTLTRHEVAECQSSQECRDAFGIDQVCNVEGYCEALELSPRCSGAAPGSGPYPDDLFTNPDFQDAILFGAMADYAFLDQRGRANAIQLAAFEANAEPEGLDGQRIGYILCDVQGDDSPTSTAPYDDGLLRADAARENARFFADVLDVPVIVGPQSSVDVINVWQEVVRQTGALLFTPVGTSLLISDLEVGPFTDEAPGLLWRVPPPDGFLAAGIGRDLIARGVRDIVIVAVRGYGTALWTQVERTLAEEDPDGDYETLLLEYDDQNDNQFVQAVADAVELRPSADEIVVLLADAQSYVRFIDLANTNPGYDGKRLFMNGPGATAQFLNDAPGALEAGEAGSSAKWFGEIGKPGSGEYRVRGVRYAAPPQGAGSRFSAFVDRYRTHGFEGDPTLQSFTAHAYDGSWMAIYAATWAKLNEPEGITGLGMARGLRKLSSGEDVDVGALGWTVVKAQFEAGQSIDLAGASSRLDYDLATEENTSGGYDIVSIVPREGMPGWTFKVIGGEQEQ